LAKREKKGGPPNNTHFILGGKGERRRGKEIPEDLYMKMDRERKEIGVLVNSYSLGGRKGGENEKGGGREA